MGQTQDVFGAAPKSVLNKPFTQIVSIADINVVVPVDGTTPIQLDKTLHSEIPGVVLNGNNTFTLPAGDYFIRVHSRFRANATGVRGIDAALVNTADDSPVFIISEAIVSAQYQIHYHTGEFKKTFTQNTTIKYVAKTAGGDTRFTDIAYIAGEAYAITISIWKLDSNVETLVQVANTDVQPVAGALVTGNIYGGELVWISVNQIEVKPVSCMADDGITPLYIATSNTPHTIITQTSTVFDVYLCKVNDGSGDANDMKIVSVVHGQALPAEVTHKRWLGFVRTDGSGNVIYFQQEENFVEWPDGIDLFSPTSTGTNYDISSFIHTRTRTYSIRTSVIGNNQYCYLYTTVPNNTYIAAVGGASYSKRTPTELSAKTTVIRAQSNLSSPIKMFAMTLKR